MKKIFLAAVAVFAVYPAVANAETAPQRFEHEGKAYSYTVENRGDYRIITGIEETSRKPFRLRVGESRVRGVMGSQQVNFPLRDVQPVVAEAKSASSVAAL
jgi:hypothetical protein